MIYTQEQLEAMSDLELNKSLSILADDYEEIPSYGKEVIIGGKQCYYDDARNIHECHCDYIDSYEDMMPLAFDAELSLISNYNKTYTACSEVLGSLDDHAIYEDAITHKNPLRALAIVWILVKQG